MLQTGQNFTLNTYFEALFDYILPPSFRIDQCDRFDEAYQNGQKAIDFLEKLQDIADTIGDFDDEDIILGFWR